MTQETVRATATVDRERGCVTWTYDNTVAFSSEDEIEVPPFVGVETGDVVELRIYRKDAATQ